MASFGGALYVANAQTTSEVGTACKVGNSDSKSWGSGCAAFANLVASMRAAATFCSIAYSKSESQLIESEGEESGSFGSENTSRQPSAPPSPTAAFSPKQVGDITFDGETLSSSVGQIVGEEQLRLLAGNKNMKKSSGDLEWNWLVPDCSWNL